MKRFDSIATEPLATSCLPILRTIISTKDFAKVLRMPSTRRAKAMSAWFSCELRDLTLASGERFESGAEKISTGFAPLSPKSISPIVRSRHCGYQRSPPCKGLLLAAVLNWP